jgi:hypothetical protein
MVIVWLPDPLVVFVIVPSCKILPVEETVGLTQSNHHTSDDETHTGETIVCIHEKSNPVL